MELAVFILAGVLLGSVPTGYLIARARGIDLRAHGSGNIGATNLGRVLGRGAFVRCFVIDALKGLVPPLAWGLWTSHAGRLDLPATDLLAYLAVMASPVLGHMFCPWLGFRGGKGVATGLGALLGVVPVLTVAGMVGLAVWLAVFRWRRIVSLASIVAAVSVPLSILGLLVLARLGITPEEWGKADLSRWWPYVALTAGLAGVVIVRHRANIARLRAGIEPRFRPADEPATGANRSEGMG